jgi:hypothetical protein
MKATFYLGKEKLTEIRDTGSLTVSKIQNLKIELAALEKCKAEDIEVRIKPTY